MALQNLSSLWGTQTGKLKHGDINTAVKETFFRLYSHICCWVSQEPALTAWFL